MIAPRDNSDVGDDIQVGRVVRDVRISRNLRQEDVAKKAGTSCESVSRLERGLVDGMTVGTLRAISKAMDMPSIVSIWWRGPEIDRLRDKDHAQLVEAVATLLVEAGWRFEPEYTSNFYGDRGSVDVLAWHPARRALLIGEVKTKIWDLQDMLTALGTKERLVPMMVARDRGWRAESVGVVLAMPEVSTHRHHIEEHGATFAAAFPDRQVRVRHWIGDPSGDLRGLWFLPISHGTGLRKRSQPQTPSPTSTDDT
jgi:transcriptional regulator with XRE-family HTH domain